jgi:hypothetical protein
MPKVNENGDKILEKKRRKKNAIWKGSMLDNILVSKLIRTYLVC